MKNRIVMGAAALVIALAVGTYAEEKATGGEKIDKDVCLLYSQDCATQVDSIQKKVQKLRTEIDKGTRVYTPEEIRALNQKLRDTERLIDELLYRNGGN